MIHVIATIQTQSGRRGDVLAEFARIVTVVQNEVGCVTYSPSIDIETDNDRQVDMRDDVITVVETWESIEALEDHLIAPHMIDFREAVKSSVKSVALQILRPA